MIRTMTRRRALRFAAIAVVFALSSPIFWATFPQAFHGTPSRLLAAASPLAAFLADWPDQGEAESQDAGTFPPGALALADSFVPEVLPPAAGGAVGPGSSGLRDSPHLPGIFRPPIG